MLLQFGVALWCLCVTLSTEAVGFARDFLGYDKEHSVESTLQDEDRFGDDSSQFVVYSLRVGGGAGIHEMTYGVQRTLLNTSRVRWYVDIASNWNSLVPSKWLKEGNTAYYAVKRSDFFAGVTLPMSDFLWLGIGGGLRYFSVYQRELNEDTNIREPWSYQKDSAELSPCWDGAMYGVMDRWIISLGVSGTMGATYDKRLIGRIGFGVVF